MAERLLSRDLVYNYVLEHAEYDKEHDTYYTFAKQLDIAEDLGIVPMTVNRSMKSLKEEGKIDYVTKKSPKKAGHVVTFNLDEIPQNPDNPITGTTVKAQEIYDAYFKPKPYVPQRRYRTKTQIAEDELKKSEEQKRFDMLNQELSGYSFVPKKFFNNFPNPEMYFKGYVLSRLYNTMLLGFAEDWKNMSERYHNEYYFNRASNYVRKYDQYDILKKGFVGTVTYNKFVGLATVMTNLDIEPEEYFGVFFNRMFYKLKTGGNATPPHINLLSSQSGLNVYNEQVAYKRKFENDHPYYETKGKVMNNHTSYPIMTLLTQAFHEGVHFNKNNYFKIDEEKLFEDIELIEQADFYTSPKYDAMKLLYRDVKESAERNDLTEEEHVALKQYVESNTAIQTNDFRIPEQYILYFYNNLSFRSSKVRRHWGEENLRPHLAHLGNLNHQKDLTTLEGQEAVETGHYLYFSIEGGLTFKSTIEMLINNTASDVDYRALRQAISKLDMAIPIADDGFIDVNVLVDELVKKAPTAKENLEKENKYRGDYTLSYFRALGFKDNIDRPWYKIHEAYGMIGNSQRDGTRLTSENLKMTKK